MAAYSMDLRIRVLQDADAGLPSAALAAKYRVSAPTGDLQDCGRLITYPGRYGTVGAAAFSTRSTASAKTFSCGSRLTTRYASRGKSKK